MTASPATDTDDAIVLDYDLDQSPEKLWRALTDPALLAAWLAPNDLAPEVGRKFALTPSRQPPVDCEILHIDPMRRLTYSWREAGDGGPALDSIVTFEITALPAGGSHLRLVHRQAAMVGAVGMAGALPRLANDNHARPVTLSSRSLSWAA